MQFCNITHQYPEKNRIFADMKQTLEEYIRQDNNFRHFLLKIDGGIMKFWAEHPEVEFDWKLYESYEQQFIDDYLQLNRRNREVAALPRNDLKLRACPWYQLVTKEICYKSDILSKMQPIWGSNSEIAEQLKNYIEDYLIDVYVDHRKCRYPSGPSSEDLYEAFMQIYDSYGIAHHCISKMLCWRPNFSIKSVISNEEYANYFSLWQYTADFYEKSGFKKMRHFVKEMLQNRTIAECRMIAVAELKRIDLATEIKYYRRKNPLGYIALTDSEIQHQIEVLNKNPFLKTYHRKMSSIHTDKDAYFPIFCKLANLLLDFCRIWAAQLLVRGIDMGELERENGIVLIGRRQSGYDDNYLYYIDKDYGDRPFDCCVYDERQAKELLAKVKYKTPPSHPTPSRKEGRPEAPAFEEYIKDDAPECFIDVLEEMLDGKTGKPAFTIILAALKWMKSEPPLQSVINRFKSIRKTSYSAARDRHYMINNHQENGKPIPESVLAPIREEIEKKLKDRIENSSKQ